MIQPRRSEIENEARVMNSNKTHDHVAETKIKNLFSYPLTAILTTYVDIKKKPYDSTTTSASSIEDIIYRIKNHISENDQIEHIGNNQFLVIINETKPDLIAIYENIVRKLCIQKPSHENEKKRIVINIISKEGYRSKKSKESNRLTAKKTHLNQEENYFDVSAIQRNGCLP